MKYRWITPLFIFGNINIGFAKSDEVDGEYGNKPCQNPLISTNKPGHIYCFKRGMPPFNIPLPYIIGN
ncbi:MAG: hypothetical protein PHV59_13060 [Victivallales bacterium]|nr:hypothetical protein [Victivallales bacterium]